jgi:hypothetical protein
MDVPEKKRLARRAQYEERLRSMPSRGTVYITYGGDPRRALQTLINGASGRGEHYVYLHRGPSGEVFYVGKGRGNRAYSKDRHVLWQHYLKTRCDGHYEVEIVKHFETEDEALDLESDLLALFVESTVNGTNAAQEFDFEVNARFNRLRKANLANISAAAALVKTKPEEAETALRKAIADMADYARLNWEQGLPAELARELDPSWGCHLNSKDLSALNKLTMLLKVQSRWGELIIVTAEFFVTYPETRQQEIAQKVTKRSEAGRAKQRC